MRLVVACVGRLKAGPERELYERYAARAAQAGRGLGLTGFDTAEIDESRAGRPADRKREEAAGLSARLGEARFVALDERGQDPTSRAIADYLARERDGGAKRLAFLIGGADGLDETLRAGAAACWRLGRITLPHQLARIVLAEQLYRATTILAGHPYHRD